MKMPMPYVVSIDDAKKDYREYEFVKALTPSAQKAAFHVRDSNGTDLCLKVISPDFDIDRVAREIESLQRISHPNIVRLVEYTSSTKDGKRRHYIVEEYIDGEDFATALKSAPIDPSEVRRIFLLLLDGLAALGEKSIVHRDLKPENIRLRTDGVPVIIDFGLARLLNAPDLTATADGAAIGTPAYFAPEQFVGDKRDIDPRTDLFATGTMLYFALVGDHPFLLPGMTFDDLKKVVCESDYDFTAPGFAALEAHWRLIIKKLLAKERVGRPQTAAHAMRLIENMTGGRR